jgi:hypothetical protein
MRWRMCRWLLVVGINGSRAWDLGVVNAHSTGVDPGGGVLMRWLPGWVLVSVCD